MFNRLRKKSRPAYVDFYIMLSGEHDVEVWGLSGISLKKVDREVYNKHKGLKYWISSRVSGRTKDKNLLKSLSSRARIDIFDLVFKKKLDPFKGINGDGIC